jgi:hypothetical protein
MFEGLSIRTIIECLEMISFNLLLGCIRTRIQLCIRFPMIHIYSNMLFIYNLLLKMKKHQVSEYAMEYFNEFVSINKRL